MTEELLPQAGDDAADQESTGTDKAAKELERARREAANYRTKLREVEGQLKELLPLADQFKAAQDAQKSEAQKALERATELERKLQEQERAAAAAQRLAKLTRLATKAGVDPDILDLLDLSKIDVDDEKAATAALSRFATRAPAAGSNPGRDNGTGMSNEEMRARYLSGQRGRPTIFGG